jgi:C_GCAxxG_C_C family probable redox protein
MDKDAAPAGGCVLNRREREMAGEEKLFIPKQVHSYYWDEDINCATTILKVLAELNQLELPAQVVAAATGLHGAGGYGAQCGLVEGGLMFLGIQGTAQEIGKAAIALNCKAYAQAFEQRYGSLLCSQLRPEGFGPNNPPHLCERLTCKAAAFAARFVEELKGAVPSEEAVPASIPLTR